MVSPSLPPKASLTVKLKKSSPGIAEPSIGSTSPKRILTLRLRPRSRGLGRAARLWMLRRRETQTRWPMDNVILFPGWIRV